MVFFTSVLLTRWSQQVSLAYDLIRIGALEDPPVVKIGTVNKVRQ